MRLALLVVVCACTDVGAGSLGDPIDNPQVPPRGFDDLATWLDAGYYTTWHCEPEGHAPRPPSPHARNRICSNDALVASTGETYSVDAAAVKEVLDESDHIRQYAVYRKVHPGAGGATWYWYEGFGSDVSTSGEDKDACTGCHGGAPRDFVFTVVTD